MSPTNYILGTIEDAGAGAKAITTYDNLILELVGIDKTIAADKIDRQFQEETLTAFQNVTFGGTEEEHAKMEQVITDYENELQEYYEIVNTSSKELNLYISADYLKMVSSVRVAPSINQVSLYYARAGIVFRDRLLRSSPLGRMSISDYLLYVDKKTGLPNREKLNIYIGENGGKGSAGSFHLLLL